MSPALHQSVTDKVLELTTLYSARALEPAGMAEFEEHLGAGCPACNAEMRAFQETTTRMAFALPERKPRPQLRQMLMDRVAKETPMGAVVRAMEGKWKAWAPGILVKRLFVDRITGAVAQLVKVEPGAMYPAHRHRGLEHVYVI